MGRQSEIAPGEKKFYARPPLASPGSREATARVGTATAIPLVLRRLGVDPTEVLTEVGLDPGLFDNPDNLISYAARCRLLNHCVTRTGCSHFGLLVGQQQGLQDLGAIGYLAQSCDDAGSALRSICQSMHVQAQGTKVSLEVGSSSAIFRYEIYEPEAIASDQTYDAAVAIMYNIMRTLCGADWRAVSVLFAHRRPKDVAPYKAFFQAPLAFDAAYNGIVFAAAWLDRPLPKVDPVLRRLMQKQIDVLMVDQGDDFASQVTRLLRTALLSGGGSENQVAGAFAMNARTLRRRLSDCGTSFRKVQQQCRLEIARQFLETSDMDVSAIAETLHYATSSSFTRAFRRWKGVTPSQWRAARSSVNSGTATVTA